MLIDPAHLQTVSFIVQNGVPVGTVFFVQLRFAEDGQALDFRRPEQRNPPSVYVANYAVTTRHSVKDERVSIRLNLRGGGSRDELIEHNAWVCHDNTDIAVLPVRFSLDDAEIAFLDAYFLVEQIGEHVYSIVQREGEERKSSVPYGIGTEVFTVGLFVGHSGFERVRPVVRFGHIALEPAPSETILTSLDTDADELTPIKAFLIEVAAWQGQSGSPVFARLWEGTDRYLGGVMLSMTSVVGMIQAAYPQIEESVITPRGEVVGYKANAGIAVVVPSADIVEMLERDERLMTERKQLAKQQKEQKLKPRPVRVVGSGQKGEGITPEGFEEALRRASRKIPDEDKEEAK